MTRSLSIGQCATFACILEVTASKPGNVHRGADFEDVGYLDFVVSGVAIGPAVEQAATLGVGATVLEAVRATQAVAGSNTNLGMALLFAPLALAASGDASAGLGRALLSTADSALAVESLRDQLGNVLRAMTANDAARVYEAIRLARPGGLGAVAQYDVHAAPPSDLRTAMAAAAPRDLIARQYANDFAEVFFAAGAIGDMLGQGQTLAAAIVHAHLQTMADHPDSLIARKCGLPTAQEAAARARRGLDAGPVGSDAYWQAIGDLDFWLRSDGHRRNPGATADVVAAGLFVGLLCGIIQPPFRWQVSAD